MEPTDPIPPSAMPEFVRNEYTRWGPAIKASGASTARNGLSSWACSAS